MGWTSRAVVGVVFAFMLASLKPAHADSLTVTLTAPSQTVSQGTTVVGFDATLLNPTGDTVYLNADSGSTSSLSVIIDDSPFTSSTTVWPLFLAPSGQTGDSFGPALLFNLDLPAGLTPGVYMGEFSIEGGPDNGTFTDFSDLADANFTLEVVTATTPEPSTLVLYGLGFLLIAALLVRRTFHGRI